MHGLTSAGNAVGKMFGGGGSALAAEGGVNAGDMSAAQAGLAPQIASDGGQEPNNFMAGWDKRAKGGHVVQPQGPAAPPMIQGGIIPRQQQAQSLFRNYDPYASTNWPNRG